MFPILSLIASFVALYFLSRTISQGVYESIFRITKERPVAISLTTFLFFPGTVIHELSHLFIAEILGVRTGKLTLVPETISDEHIRTGSVMVAKSDPFRRAVIGLAPLMTGITACILISSISLRTLLLPYLDTSFQSWLDILVPAVSYYLLFIISTSMFPSGEDMKGVWPLALTLLVLTTAAFLFGFRLTLTTQTTEAILGLLGQLASNLWMVAIIDAVVLLSLRLIIWLEKRMNL